MKYLTGLLTLVFIVTLCLPATIISASTTNTTPEGGATVPEGAFYFETANTLASSSYDSVTDKFKEILKGHELYVLDQTVRLKDHNFAERSVSGGITDANGKSLWNSNFSSYLKSETSSTIKIKQGSASFDIFMPFTQRTTSGPKGSTVLYSKNKQIVQNTIAAISTYKSMIQEGVLAGSIPNSYNVYSIYPDASLQVPVTDILEKVAGKDYSAVKPSGSKVKMVYSLDFFYSPLFGKMGPDQITALKGDWSSRVKDVKLTPSSGETVSVSIDSNYLSFADGTSAESETITRLENASVTKSDGVKNWTAPTANKKVEPQNRVDSAMRLMVPTIFARSTSNNNFAIDKVEGFSLIPDTKLRISHNLVYGKDSNDKYSSLGSYADFGIDDKSLVLGSITLDKDGKPASTKKGGVKTVGAVIPLWYKEAIYDTSQSIGTPAPSPSASTSPSPSATTKPTASAEPSASPSATSPSDAPVSDTKVYWTGRTVKFGNDYSGKITFDGLNKDLLGLDIKAGGKQPVAIRKFAFMLRAEYQVGDDHKALPEENPQVFQLEPAFLNTDGVKGFALFRNNYYIDDSELVSWLQTTEAQAMTEVKALDLLKKIQGNFDQVKPGQLDFKQWNRMAEIKSELTVNKKAVIVSWIRIITMTFGVLLIFYSILLVIAYWIDIFNFLTEFSLLNLMTRGRLYPISSEDDIAYISRTKSDVKYVTLWRVVFLCLSGMAVGILFIFCNPIIDALIWVYYQITSWVGVV